jgi:hypothetical protein
MVDPREAIALFLVMLAASAVGRVVARRIAGLLISAEPCPFTGPTDEAWRLGENLQHGHRDEREAGRAD